MRSESIFSWKRFILLIKKDLFFGSRAGLVAAAVVFAFLLVLALTQLESGGETMITEDDDPGFHQVWFGLLLFVGGFLFTSIIYNELNTPQKRHVYLSLPSTNLEKLSSKLFLSAFIYPLIALITYYIFSLIINSIAVSVFNFRYDDFMLADYRIWRNIGLYMVLQSLFLLGAIHFNKHAFLKTTLSLILLGAIFLGITYLLSRLALWGYVEGWGFELRPDYEMQPSPTFEAFIGPVFVKTVKLLFWLLMAPFIWVIAFFKLKEREV